MNSPAELESVLLQQRGILRQDAAVFFTPDYEQAIHNPLLLTDMAEAIDRIYQAMAQRERIVVHGDYDADGVSSTAILVSVLRRLGGNVTPFIPHRNDDGYGVHQRVVDRLAEEMDLLITVDCGISAVAEIGYLKERGIDTIVIDHHALLPVLPPAYAVIHPLHPHAQTPYPFPWLCGAGLAWKVAQGLLRDKRAPRYKGGDEEKWLLDLAVLGTVADVVPLLGENRAIVKFGLEVLKRTPRPGLQALLASVHSDRTKLTTADLAFRVLPLLNAAGRMDHAQPALELLLAETSAQAAELALALKKHNQLRQTLTRRVVREAEEQVISESSFIFAASTTWPAGVVGLAASRLARKFSRPAIVVGTNGRHAVGSARSPAATNILELLRHAEQHLLKLGGHAQAAGFTVNDNALEDFRRLLGKFPLAPSLAATSHPVADAITTPALLTWDTQAILERFAPYGAGNEQPALIIRSLPLIAWRKIGKNQDHAKFTFAAADDSIDGIGFGLAGDLEGSLNAATNVAVLARLEVNEYLGRHRLQLNVLDVAPANTVTISEHVASHAAH